MYRLVKFLIKILQNFTKTQLLKKIMGRQCVMVGKGFEIEELMPETIVYNMSITLTCPQKRN
eukprot:Pgem_evm1s7568